MSKKINLADEAATTALGARIAKVLMERGRAVVYLRGELGAGKTTLARGLLREAGVKGTLRSPTYTLMEPYTVETQGFLHLDLYRLADPAEVEGLGLQDFAPQAEKMIWLVEWPEQGEGYLPEADLEIDLSHRGQARRAELGGPLSDHIPH